MGIPSSGDVRGQIDTVGYAATAEGMARVWELAAQAPRPEALGDPVEPGVLGVIGPHDDYIYTAPVYREIFPLVTAKTVVLIGPFHRYRKYEARDRLVFDTYRAWRSPDGEVPVSSLREELMAALPRDMAVQDDAAHDSEHSLEPILYWLRHARRDLEIVPIIMTATSFERFTDMAAKAGDALADAMKRRGWQLGRDVAIVISTDGTHYGDDFKYSPYGAGGVEALSKAREHDRRLIRETLAGPLRVEGARGFFDTVVDPARPDTYRVPWCGRFSVTFGTMFLQRTAERLGLPTPRGYPIALGVSVDTPELDVRKQGMAPTNPANLYHFVTHPAIAYR